MIINTEGRGIPLCRAKVADGPSQLIVIPDGNRTSVADIDCERLAANATFAYLDLRAWDYVHHCRLTASIALVKAAA